MCIRDRIHMYTLGMSFIRAAWTARLHHSSVWPTLRYTHTHSLSLSLALSLCLSVSLCRTHAHSRTCTPLERVPVANPVPRTDRDLRRAQSLPPPNHAVRQGREEQGLLQALPDEVSSPPRYVPLALLHCSVSCLSLTDPCLVIFATLAWFQRARRTTMRASAW